MAGIGSTCCATSSIDTRLMERHPMTSTRNNGRALGYIRVSTDQQRDSGLGLEAQQHALEQTARRLSLSLAQTFTDAGLSGSLSIDERPGLADALNSLRRGDVLIVPNATASPATVSSQC
jgi:hypothetical protein